MQKLVALAVALLFSLSFASPAEAQRDSTPRDYRAGAKDTQADQGRILHPERWRALNADKLPPVVEQSYTPDPAIWRLKDSDTTIYFFGTYHALPAGFKWRSERLNAILGEVDEVVFESRDEDDDRAQQEMMADLFAGFENNTPMSERLTPESAVKWRKLAEDLEMPFEMLDRMPPTLIIFAFGMTALQEAGSDFSYGVENVLEAEFLRMRKPISAIEDPVAVMQSILDLDDTVIVESLEEMLSKWDGNGDFNPAGYATPTEETDETSSEMTENIIDDEHFAELHDWAQGYTNPDPFGDWMEEPLGKELYDVLLVKRNREWSDWLEDRLTRPGVLLVAVGAGHFEGADAVQVMMRDRGYFVERINPRERPQNKAEAPVLEDSAM